MPIRVNMPALMRLFFGRHSWLPLMTGHPFWEATFDQHLGWLLVRGFTVCVSKLTIIGSDNGLSPGRRQAIIWTNAGILLIGPLRTIFSEIFIKIHAFSFKNMRLKMSSAKWPFCLGLNVLILKYVGKLTNHSKTQQSVNRNYRQVSNIRRTLVGN